MKTMDDHFYNIEKDFMFGITFREIEGDLIKLALEGKFDVIAHGCNCFCIQGAGIAKQMAKTFETNDVNAFPLESKNLKGSIHKLGQIEWNISKELYIINAYTQYQPGSNLDMEALTLCMRKINHEFKGKHIGLPLIGCGIAGGDWKKIKPILETELSDMKVTIVHYDK